MFRPFQAFGGWRWVLWLYSGYEQVSSVAEEVKSARSYPIALAVVIPLSIATYFLPTMFSLAALGELGEVAYRIFLRCRTADRRRGLVLR